MVDEFQSFHIESGRVLAEARVNSYEMFDKEIQPIDESLFDGTVLESSLYFGFLEAIHDFLLRPILIDNIPSHDERIKLKKQLRDKYKDEKEKTKILDEDRLRGNLIASVFNCMGRLYAALKEKLGTDWEKHREYLILKEKILLQLREGTSGDKKTEYISNVRALSELLYEFYNIFIDALKKSKK